MKIKLKKLKEGQKEPQLVKQKVFLLPKYQQLLTFWVQNPNKKIMFLLLLSHGITHKQHKKI